MSGRVYVSTYYRSPRELRDRDLASQAHKVREGPVAFELLDALVDAGYRFGGTIINIPADARKGLGARLQPTPLDLQPADLVLLPTRPALSEDGRRPLLRSQEPLEEDLFAELGFAFEYCSRAEVRIQSAVPLGPKAERFRVVEFGIRHGAPASALSRRPAERGTSVGYAVGIPSLGSSRCRALAAFGLGGTESVIVAQLLRTELRRELDNLLTCFERRLLVIQFRVPDFVPCPRLAYAVEALEPRIVFAGPLC